MNAHPVVLYVDDDPRSRLVIQTLLTKKMLLEHVTIFDDSTDFLTRVKALAPQPELILLDIHVGPLDGFQMLDQLRNAGYGANIPVVALTASVMNDEIVELRNKGFHSCLAKPVDPHALPDQIHHIQEGEHLWFVVNP